MGADALRQNLARLRRRAPELAVAIGAADDSGVEVVAGPRGQHTLACDGSQLASRYDPRAEGERLAEAMLAEPADILIVVGFALGHVCEALLRLTRAHVVVYEPSLARLRAALALSDDLTGLGSDTLHVCTDVEALRGAIHALYVPGVQMRLHSLPAIARIDPGAVRDAVSHVARTKEAIDIVAATRVQMNEVWARITVQNLPQLLRTPSISELEGRFEGVPAVIAAAGPSLTRQLPKLREMRERVLLIAIGQAVGALRDAGIEPDLVHVVETQDVTHQLTDFGGSEGANLAILASVHPKLYALPARSRFTIYPQPNHMARWIAEGLGGEPHRVGGGTVAQSAAFLAHNLGADPILLIGQDLAFTGGEMYAAGTSYADVGFRQTRDDQFVYTNRQRKLRLFHMDAELTDEQQTADLIWVEGWHGDRVPTNQAYATFIEQYREIGQHMRSIGARLWNCTEGGAKLPEVEAVPFAEALEGCAPGGPVFRDFEGVYRASEPPQTEQLERKRRTDLGVLRELERELDGADRAVERAARGLAPGTSRQRMIELLRRVGRGEKRVRKLLERVEWIDALTQVELHDLAARVHTSELPENSPRRAVEEARGLFRSARRGLARAREILDAIAAGIAEFEGERADATTADPEPKEPAPARAASVP